MSVAAQDGQGNGDGDAPADADSDGVGYVSYDESASDTEVPAANHRDENDPLGQAPMNVALLPSRGKYDQRAAKRAPMQPAKSHHLEDDACGDDSDCILALTPGRLGNVTPVFEAVEDLRKLLDGMAYALRDSLYCACHIQPGAWHCMLPAHDVRSCVEHLRL